MSKIKLTAEQIFGVNVFTLDSLLEVIKENNLDLGTCKIFLHQIPEDQIKGIVKQPTGDEHCMEEFVVCTGINVIDGNIYLSM